MRVLYSWRTVLFLFGSAEALPDSTKNIACTPEVLGLGSEESQLSPADALQLCGVAYLRHVFTPAILTEILDRFQHLPDSTVMSLRHGSVRANRVQTHLPFIPPFNQLPLLGPNGELQSPLRAALGEKFVLDLATVVEVPPHAESQEPHRDSPLSGTVAVHIPLQPLMQINAPLALCVGTHEMTNAAAQQVMREAILWRPRHESSVEAKRRLFCGGREKTLAFDVSSLASDIAKPMKVHDSRLGVKILALPSGNASLLGWKVGDEITHVNGQATSSSEDWWDAVEQLEGSHQLNFKLQRPTGQYPIPPLLALGAPLEVGDVLMYDSRTWHWGTENRGTFNRAVLYVNFKSTSEHPGVHPEATSTPDLKTSRVSFQAQLQELQTHFAGFLEL